MKRNACCPAVLMLIFKRAFSPETALTLHLALLVNRRLDLPIIDPPTMQLPMREVPPTFVPKVEVPALDGGAARTIEAHYVSQFVHVPFSRQEVNTLKQSIPDIRKNPSGFYKEIESVLH